MIVTCVLAASWLLAWFAPETPIGRACHTAMVDWPACKLSAIRRGHLIAALMLSVIVGTICWFGQGEAAKLLAMAGPDALAWWMMVDGATLVEAVATAVFTAATMRLQRWRAPSRWRRTGAARARRARTDRSKVAANDDEDGRALRRAS